MAFLDWLSRLKKPLRLLLLAVVTFSFPFLSKSKPFTKNELEQFSRELLEQMGLQSDQQRALDQAADDNELRRIESMIQSMTRKEKNDPELFLSDEHRQKQKAHEKLSRRKRRAPKMPDPGKELTEEAFIGSRVERVARGSGNETEAVRGLISRFIMMRDMFGVLGDLMGTSGGGLMGKIPGMGKLKQLNAARKLARDPEALQAMMGGQMPSGGMPGMDAFAGLGGMGAPAAPITRKQATQKKSKRKSSKNARKKNRRK